MGGLVGFNSAEGDVKKGAQSDEHDLTRILQILFQICGWILGPDLCDIWTSCDVLCCTASILHLVAIATDR